MTFSISSTTRLFSVLTLVMLGLTGCYYVEPYPPGPGYPPPVIGDPLPARPGWSPGQITAFEQGRDLGQADGRRGVRPNFERYAAEFPPVLRPYAREGYRIGYEEADYNRPDEAVRERVYEDGYSMGRSDYRQGLRPRPSRYDGDYPRKYEFYFTAGYEDGYNGEPHRMPRQF